MRFIPLFSFLISIFLPSISIQAEELTAIPSPDSPPSQSRQESDPILLNADEVTYDETLGISTARGNVEISARDSKGEVSVLQADTVTFNEKSNLVTATGNVKLFSPSGEVYKASYVELTDDLKFGFINKVRLLTADNYRFAARRGYRTDGSITDMEEAVYSPCNLCTENPRNPPIWQLKAKKVRRDENDLNIYYTDAWMEMGGVPVLYTPYLSHPDPSVKRRSGFLMPSFGNSTDLGFMASVPYYYVINDSQDLTITPTFITKETSILNLEYRQRFLRGEWTTNGSITQSKGKGGTAGAPVIKPNRIRGHIKSKIDFDLSDRWRGGAELNRASDPTYVRRYEFQGVENPQTGYLESKIFAEGFYNRSYASIRGYSFQPMQVNVSQKTAPFVTPLASYNYVGPQRAWGDYFFGNTSVAVITREQGTDMRRTSFEGGWQLPYYGSIGDIYTLTATMRADGYNVSNYQPTYNSNKMSSTTGRLFPQVGLNWRYPLSNPSLPVPLLVEPMLGFVASPKSGNSINIPNEDSGDFQFDETTLFKLDRFPGIDRVDNGQRFNYGMTIEAYPLSKRFGTFFLGQSYSFNNNKAIPTGVGIEKGFSDIIGSTVLTPYTDTKIKGRILWDKRTFRARQSQVGFEVGPPIFRVTGDYLYAAKNSVDTSFNGKEQIVGSISSQITPFWKIIFEGSRNLGKAAGNLAQSYSAAYEDECLLFKGSFIRTFYQDRDIRPDNIVLFTVGFKTLGDFSTGNVGLTSHQKDAGRRTQRLLGK